MELAVLFLLQLLLFIARFLFAAVKEGEVVKKSIDLLLTWLILDFSTVPLMCW